MANMANGFCKRTINKTSMKCRRNPLAHSGLGANQPTNQQARMQAYTYGWTNLAPVVLKWRIRVFPFCSESDWDAFLHGFVTMIHANRHVKRALSLHDCRYIMAGGRCQRCGCQVVASGKPCVLYTNEEDDTRVDVWVCVCVYDGVHTKLVVFACARATTQTQTIKQYSAWYCHITHHSARIRTIYAMRADSHTVCEYNICCGPLCMCTVHAGYRLCYESVYIVCMCACVWRSDFALYSV